MKIVDLRVHLVQPVPNRTWVFVEVETDEGITGVGEATNAGGGGALVVGRAYEMLREDIPGFDFSDGLIGQDASHIERIWQQVYRRFGTLGSRGLATTLCSGERYAATGVMIMLRRRGSRIEPPALKL